jgi:hypothetical protein
MFTLVKLSYIVCDEDEKLFYDDLKTMPIEQHTEHIPLSYIQNPTDETVNESMNNNNAEYNSNKISRINKIKKYVPNIWMKK